tara:strand:+ start:342 stop:596 length:255 start_codon:yes stop_codon:yes gene_type:complete
MLHESQTKKDIEGLAIFLRKKRYVYKNVKVADNHIGEALSNNVIGACDHQGCTEIKKSLLKKSIIIIKIPIEELINQISSCFFI